MNLALYNAKGDEFFIASIRNDGDKFIALGKRIASDGRVVSIGQSFVFTNNREAEHKVKDLIKMKIKRRGWMPIGIERLPQPVVRFLEVPPDMRVTPEELVMILRKAQIERYVIFEDNSGLEEYFDSGVEYLGFECEDDNRTVKVFDRYGQLRDCFTCRMKSVVPTEKAIEAEKLKHVADALENK